MAHVAWLGLGVLGAPMAGHLITKGGHTAVVYNRTSEKADKWVAEFGGKAAATPAEAAEKADFVFACVDNDDDLLSVTTGPDGAFSTMPAGAIFIDHTTTSAKVARELSETAEQKKLSFLDCPVSGGEAGAVNGILTVMAGGTENAFKCAEPVMQCYSRMIRRIGPSGSGQLAKMVNQIAVAGVVQGLAEAIHFAEQVGLDLEAVMSTISKGAAQSWQMENRWQTMHERKFDFGFAVDWMLKDLNICLDEAKNNQAQLPITEQIEKFYSEIRNAGGNRWDTSSLITRFDKK